MEDSPTVWGKCHEVTKGDGSSDVHSEERITGTESRRLWVVRRVRMQGEAEAYVKSLLLHQK